MLYEDTVSSGEPSTYMEHVNRLKESVEKNAEEKEIIIVSRHLLEALFQTEIEKRVAMDTFKTAKYLPKPLPEDVIEAAMTLSSSSMEKKKKKEEEKEDDDTCLWSVEQAGAYFISSILFYSNSAKNGNSSSRLGSFVFDKDEDECMKFVAAASLLRSSIFFIPGLSLHEARGIAGNIIPAIATTNAIVAGIQVLQAFKMLARPDSDIQTVCAHTYCLRSRTRKGVYLQPTKPEGPSKNCFVCNKTMLVLVTDTHERSLEELLGKVIKTNLGIASPSVYIGDNCIYEVH